MIRRDEAILLALSVVLSLRTAQAKAVRCPGGRQMELLSCVHLVSYAGKSVDVVGPGFGHFSLGSLKIKPELLAATVTAVQLLDLDQYTACGTANWFVVYCSPYAAEAVQQRQSFINAFAQLALIATAPLSPEGQEKLISAWLSNYGNLAKVASSQAGPRRYASYGESAGFEVKIPWEKQLEALRQRYRASLLKARAVSPELDNDIKKNFRLTNTQFGALIKELGARPATVEVKKK